MPAPSPTDLIHPDLTIAYLRRRMTGRGVRVAVIDSGVDGTHPALAGCLTRVVVPQRDAAGGLTYVDIDPAASVDRFGHGTGVAGIIADIAPAVAITSVSVLDDAGSGSGELMLAALGWALEQDVQVINLSLSLNADRYFAEAARLCERAYEREITLVVARRNLAMKIGAPAMFSSVISVDKDEFRSKWQLAFNPRNIVEFAGRGYNVQAPTPGGQFSLMTGTSFATPQVTGIVALLKEWAPHLVPVELKSALKALASRDPDGVPAHRQGRELLRSLRPAELQAMVDGLDDASLARLRSALDRADPQAWRQQQADLLAELADLRAQLAALELPKTD